MMKRFAAMALFSSFALNPLRSAAADFVVAPNGSDTNPGTVEQPLASLEAARDAVRRLTSEGDAIPEGGVRVLLRGGRYFIDKTFELDHRDSGREGSPVVFASYPGETAILDGGVVIRPDDIHPLSDPRLLERVIDEAARPHIRQINLATYGFDEIEAYGPRGFRRAYRAAPPELFIGGQPMSLARWPNKGENPNPLGAIVDPGSMPSMGEFDMRPAVFRFEVERALRWAKARDLHISGIFGREWADDTLPIAKLDAEEGTMTTAVPHLYGFHQRPFCSWYAVNLLEEINSPGEYYIDREARMLYVYPPAGGNELLVQVSRLGEVMVAIEGASYVHLQGLVLENARSSGIYIERGASNRVVGCTLRNLGELAIQIGQGTEPLPEGRHNGHGIMAPGVSDPALSSRKMGSWHEHIYKYPAAYFHGGYGHHIQSCDIYNTGAGGIRLFGGNRKTLEPGRHEVVNCDIHHVNRLDRTYKAHINLEGVGHRIAHNHLHHSEGQAIYLHGNDHVIEFNEIDHVCGDISDMAAIYMGRDPSELGHVIRHNFMHNLSDPHHGRGAGVQAIFFDDGTLYAAQVVGNVFYRAGSTGVVKHNLGGGASVANNIAIECPPLKVFTFKTDTTDRAIRAIRDEDAPLPPQHNKVQYHRVRVEDPDDLRGVHIGHEPYRSAYPYLYESWTTGRNVGVQPYNNIETSDLSQFADAERLDFSLRPDATVDRIVATGVVDRVRGIEVERAAFEPIPFDQIGLYVDEYRKSTGVRRIRDVPYLGEDRPQRMDLYLPRGKIDELRPAVLLIHGGGWATGAKDASREQAFGEFIASQGYVAASISYTLAKFEGKPWKSPMVKPGWPDNIHDCKSALRFLRARSEDYGIDPERIAVMGGSAGGHLALLTGLSAGSDELNRGGLYTEESNQVSGIISFYGIPDVRRWGGNAFLGASLEEAPETWALASPVEHLSDTSPPILLIHGDQDATVKIELGQEFADILRERGLDHQFVIIAGAPHSFALDVGDTDLRPVVGAFLSRIFGR